MKSWIKNTDIVSLAVDVLLLFFGIYALFKSPETFAMTEYSGNEASIILILSLTIVPWYTGYLLFHFDHISPFLRTLVRWIFGLGILSLIIFLIISFLPSMGKMEDVGGFALFLSVFGMFFTVIGPLMIIAGFNDTAFLDANDDPKKPIEWPIVTWAMFMVIFAVLFMILIIGAFNPDPDGNAAIWVVALGFIGGTLLGMAVVAGIGYLIKMIAESDKNRHLLRLTKFLIPLIVLNSLIWWNDIALGNIYKWGNYTPLTLGDIVLSMTLCGVLPFRILMLLKPPVDWRYFVSGIVALSIYITGLYFNLS